MNNSDVGACMRTLISRSLAYLYVC